MGRSRSKPRRVEMVRRMRATIEVTLSVVLLTSCITFPAQALTDTNLDAQSPYDNSSANASDLATLPDQSTSGSTDVMPDNPNQELPDTVDSSLPNDATVVSSDLAVTNDGQVKEIETGEAVNDPELVGTDNTSPDPLAKTQGDSFIPVSLEDVKEYVDASDQSAESSSYQSVGSGARTSGRHTSAKQPSVRQAALGNNSYGAHWGTYNGTQAFFESNGTLFAQNAKGVVDVSQWQGSIDWSRAKAAGVEGAIIRLSYGWGNGFDTYALRNISECKRLGIPFGIYMYSYSYNSSTAASEGASVVNLLNRAGVKPGDLSYPVYYDLERWTWTGHTPPTSPSVYDGIVNAWYAKLNAGGYTNLSVYSYTNYLNTALNSTNIRSKTRWVASYGARTGFNFSTGAKGWQYASDGKVNGISGNVDLNAFTATGTNVSNLTAISIPNGKYYINASIKDSSSLDIPGASTLDGAKTQLYGFNKSPAQRFDFTRQSDGSYVITNAGSGKVLDVEAGQAKDGAVVRQWRANGSAAQRWYLRDSGSGYYIQSALGNWVLDINGGRNSNGTSIRLYSPNGTSAQKFLVSSADSDIPVNVTMRISSAINQGLVLDIPAACRNNGARVQLYSWNESSAQQYRFTEVGNGVFQITNVGSGKAVEVAGGATGNGGAVQQYGANGTLAQHWSVISPSSGRYIFANNASGKAMDVPGGQARSSVKLQIYAGNYSAAQQWTVSRYVTPREKLNQQASQHQSDLPDGVYSFGAASKPTMRLDVEAGSHASGANVRIWSANSTNAQRWRVTHDANGYVTLTNVGSSNALDVAAGSAAPRTNVRQYSWNGTWAQKWIAVKQSDGSYVFLSAVAQNRALDMNGGLTAEGTNVQLYTANNTAAQRWKKL